MYRLAKFSLIMTAAALLCWPAPLLSGPTVPYKDRIAGTGTIVNVSGPTVTVALMGKGEATHFGRCKVEGLHKLTFLTPTSGTVDGSGAYTAADGSTIAGIYSGTFTTIPGGRQLTLTAVFKQGTGRLAGFTGKVTTTVNVTVTPNPLSTTFTYASTGTLTFP
jgi:hypothetical protein